MRRLCWLLLAGSCSAGCVLSPPQPPDYLEREELAEVPTAWDHDALPGEVVDGWVERFDDHRLAALVQYAQDSNPNLKAAYTNIQRADALLRQSAASLRPAVSSQLTYDTNGDFDGDSRNTAQFFLPVSYLLDVWGGNRAGIAAANADFDAAWLNYKFAQLSLAAAVAKAYFLAVESAQQVTINEANVDALVRISQIVELQYQQGAVTQQDLDLALSDVASAESQLVTSQQAARNARRILNLVLGNYPSDDIDVPLELPALPAIPSAGVPAELLERRPDLVAAANAVFAAFNRVYVAEVSRYPRITLSGNLGGIAQTLGELFTRDRLSWSVGPSLGLPLYQGGALIAQVDAATAAQQAAIASYANQALEALSDVEVALDSNQTLAAQEKFILVSFATAKSANRIARLRYENGDISLVDLIDIQRREFLRHSELTTNRRRQLDARIELFLALGGDWRTSVP